MKGEIMAFVIILIDSHGQIPTNIGTHRDTAHSHMQPVNFNLNTEWRHRRELCERTGNILAVLRIHSDP